MNISNTEYFESRLKDTDDTLCQVDVYRVSGNTSTQMRVTEDEDTIKRYIEVLQGAGMNSWPFPAVELVWDGKTCWIADGFHRINAGITYAIRNGLGVYLCQARLKRGTQRDAELIACGANADHGLPRSQSDKEHAVNWVLDRYPEWSDREVARVCNVSHPYVGKMRRKRAEANEVETLPDRQWFLAKVAAIHNKPSNGHAPGQAAPGQAAPGQVAPGQAAPGQSREGIAYNAALDLVLSYVRMDIDYIRSVLIGKADILSRATVVPIEVREVSPNLTLDLYQSMMKQLVGDIARANIHKLFKSICDVK